MFVISSARRRFAFLIASFTTEFPLIRRNFIAHEAIKDQKAV